MWVSVGMTGILLKYRCPRRPGDVKGVPPAGPLKDAQRAVSLVRSKAKEWGIDPAKIGMVGFSAGGHLVGATATNSFEPPRGPANVTQLPLNPAPWPFVAETGAEASVRDLRAAMMLAGLSDRR